MRKLLRLNASIYLHVASFVHALKRLINSTFQFYTADSEREHLYYHIFKRRNTTSPTLTVNFEKATVVAEENFEKLLKYQTEGECILIRR